MCGVAFFAGLSNTVEFVNNLLRSNIIHHPGIIENIQPWQADMEELTVDFDDIASGNNINIYAFCEGRRMEEVGILVKLSSARRSARSNYYKVEDADHMEVCKPPSKKHPSYRLLLQFIKRCQKVARECDRALQEVHDLPEAMFGLETYIEKVETLVISEQRNADPQYVGVRGMGGVGKTLLLQRVYASEKIHDHFRGAKFIWCTVTQTPNIMALYHTLSAELGLEPQTNLNLEDYKLKLHTQFKQNRVFLVLDDVWKEEAFKSLDLARGKGSVTLLSTRNQAVFDRSPRQITQQYMDPLSEGDSWKLFCVHAFKPPSNVPFELEALTLAKSIAAECDGLPLALKVVGGAMSGKTIPKYEWEPLLNALRESRMRDKTVEEQLYGRLKLGYDLLSEDDYRLKKCFHYFAAFPEDSTIVFEEILFHWTAEGLVCAHGGDDSTADAISLLKKLWERSFIESNGQFDLNIKYMLNFKLHDVMRDLALYLLSNNCDTPPAQHLYFYRADRNLDKVPQECTEILEGLRLSLDTNKLEQLPENLHAPKLLTLLLGRNPIVSLPAKFLSNFPNLRVLNLRNAQFHSLPEELGDVKNLICLDLSNCHHLETLPDTVRKLQELKFLILDHCWSLKYLPSAVNALTSLQVLHTANCDTLKWADYIPSSVGRAQFSRHVHPTIKASLEQICGLVNLTELTISADEDEDEYLTELTMFADEDEDEYLTELMMFADEDEDELMLFADEDEDEHLTELTMFANEDVDEHLTELTMFAHEDEELVKLPHNIFALTKLKLLQVYLDIEDLPAETVYRCMQLQEFELCSSKLNYLPSSFTACGMFPALIRLKVCCCNLDEFPKVAPGTMSKLRTLDLSGCTSLKTLPLSLELLPSLNSLIVVRCMDILKDTCRKNCETSAIWSKWHIQYSYRKGDFREYKFNPHSIHEKALYLRWKRERLQRMNDYLAVEYEP